VKLTLSNVVFGLALLVMLASAPTCRSCEHRAAASAPLGRAVPPRLPF